MRVVVMGLALLWLSGARTAAAAELIIEWHAPSDCPDRNELSSRVERLIGDDVVLNMTAATSVTRSAGAYRAEVRVTSPAGIGTRVIEDTRCDRLADNVALIVALSAAPLGVAPKAIDDAPDRLRFVAAVSGNLLLGTLPSSAAGVGGQLAAESSALRLELRAAHYFTQTAVFPNEALGAHFALDLFGVRVCRLFAAADVEVAACLGADVLAITAQGFGGATRHSARVPCWGPAAGVLARFWFSEHLGVGLAADGFVPLSRRHFVFDDVGLLHRPSTIALQLLLAGEVRF
jgi:hypothetical protein